MKDLTLIQEQIQYYRQRALEYDEWFLRQGRYYRGEEHRQQWFSEVHQVELALKEARPFGRTLELACGTGLWTQHLTPFATHITAVDASPEVIALNQQRINSTSVNYVVADIFTWIPLQKYDFIFFGFWLSHVPTDRFNLFWEIIFQALKPGGKVFFVDSLFNQNSTAKNHSALHQRGYSERKLNNGITYRVVKVFYEPTSLEISLRKLGWSSNIQCTSNYFTYGLICPEDNTESGKAIAFL